ncbi:hypothetical protein V6N11_078990 [Hibiscus sabdariffa]|uniref:Rx N-terminal domain-containing protein n=1 Tax=Hibiscus sabdariffa TaxID=183260 RepID=A0ABR2RUR3_9ROSI
MALSAVSSAVQTIGHVVAQEAIYLWGVEEQVDCLQSELKWMQIFLRKVDAKPALAKDEIIRLWVAEIRELAYDAEDVIEDFALGIGSMKSGGLSNCIKRSACILKDGRMLHQTRSKIDKTFTRVTDLVRRLQAYGIKELREEDGASTSAERRESRRPYPHIIDDNIVGLDNDVKKLVSVIVDEENESRVVSICGMGEEGDGNEGSIPEDLAERYLMELVQRCMVQVRERDIANLKIKSVQMHDLMRNLCLSKAKQENFLCFVDESNASLISTVRRIHRVSATSILWIQRIKSPNLRSFLFFGEWRSGLEFGRPLLPSSLGNLRLLQTLDLRVSGWGTGSVHVPNVIWKMEQLRHLYLPDKCKRRTKLELGTLRNLQTLVNFNTKNCYLKDLINMTKIRELVIRGPFEIKDFNAEDSNKNPSVIQGRYLHSLSIIHNEGRIDPRHLNHLLSSCASVSKLTLDVEISVLPEYVYSSSSLTYLNLRMCKLEKDPMPTLKELPSLRVLELHPFAFEGKKMHCSTQDFPKLESLTLYGLNNLEEWKVDAGAMPCLQRLEINACRGLKVIPDGLRYITMLQELEIKSMPKMFIDKLVEGGEDFGEVRHVPSRILKDCDE